jgi:hypothetical protein
MATKGQHLRDSIFALLRETAMTADEELAALSQCAAHIRNRRIIGDIAPDCGLTLTGFLSNDALEFYYNIQRGRHDLGYISKGWEDPGFRIGDLVRIGWWDKDVVTANTAQIMRVCATNGIAITIQERPLAIELQLDGVIYSDRFDRETFLQTLDSLNACVGRIESLVPGHHQGRLPPPFGSAAGRLPETSGRFH